MRKINLTKGIGLLELMLVIIIITSIILGATKYYLVTKTSMRITQSQEIINNVAQAAYKWAEGHTNFSSITNIGILVNAGLLPSTYGNNNISPWEGTNPKNITVEPNCDGKWIAISLGNLPGTKAQKACSILVAKYGSCPSDDVCSSSLDSCAITNPTFSACLFLFRSP